LGEYLGGKPFSKKGSVMDYDVFPLLIVGFDVWSCEIVEDDDFDEDTDQATRETKESGDDADDREDHSDGSSP
jgi:hypothetical protein